MQTNQYLKHHNRNRRNSYGVSAKPLFIGSIPIAASIRSISRETTKDAKDDEELFFVSLVCFAVITFSYLSDALSFARASDPGQRSSFINEFSGLSVVLIISCRSVESLSIYNKPVNISPFCLA